MNPTAAPNDARRDARRSVAKIDGPKTAMAAASVSARPVSQPSVDVVRVNTTTRCRFVAKPAPGTYERDVPAPRLQGHDDRLSAKP